jgi:DNA-binding CsgD family transcriptional regulator
MRVLDAIPTPLLVLGASGSVEFANEAAQKLLASPDLFSLRKGQLIAAGVSTQEWSAALRQAEVGETAVLPFMVARRKTVTSGVLRIRSIRSLIEYRIRWPRAEHLASVEVFGSAERRAAGAALALRYELTPTEVLVLQLLAEGSSPSAIAERLAIGVATVRSHLRSLYQKTGMRRQAELVRLLAR